MLYNENLHEEEQHLIQQIAEQTERGKIGWELTEYNPLSFLNEDKIDKNPAVICQLMITQHEYLAADSASGNLHRRWVEYQLLYAER